MGNLMGIINTVESSRILREMTLHRPLATVPFGGKYRMIDFILSGMVNSAIDNIGILAPYQHRSLLDHLRSGRDWQLGRKKDGLTLLPPPYDPKEKGLEFDWHHFHSNLDFLQKSRQEFVIVASAGVIGNFDFSLPFRFHTEVKADITCLYQKQPSGDQDCPNCILLDIGNDNRVTAIRFSPPQGDNTNFFLGMFMLRKGLLIQLIQTCFAENAADCLFRVISNHLQQLKVYAYLYPGHIARIHCLHSYYRHSMDLLDPKIWRELFQPGKIYTKSKDEAPAKYVGQAKATNALVAGGCSIKGTVDHSILFHRVIVDEGTHIKNSILMPNTAVAKNACLEHVICDKDVRISAGICLKGSRENPLFLKKGTVI
ncbi:MAG: glucose-1-phosphate adenylyltransferase subunit GlgD [Veillonellales bacterium]